MVELVVSGASMLDGTGAPARLADVAVAGGRIVAIGELSGLASASTVDATGCLLTPGFIDVHAHSDFSLLINRRAESSVRQGVTTEVVGNCGMGCAPLRDPADLPLVSLDCLPDVLRPSWNSFSEWLTNLESEPTSINVAALAGHGPIRQAVMHGADREATPGEIRTMVAHLDECLEAGAIGFSSGLEYNPGKSATTDELRALVAAAARRGGYYATHIRNRDYGYREAISEALDDAAAGGASLQISHVAPRWGAAEGGYEAALDAIERSAAAGNDIWFDNHPFMFGRGVVASALPPAAFAGGLERFRDRLSDPDERRRFRDYPNPQWKHWKEERWDLLTIYDAPHTPEAEGRTVLQLADASARDPWDVVCDLLLAEWSNPSMLYWSAPIHAQADVDASYAHPRGLIMSDGSSMAPYGPYAGVKHVYAYGWVGNVLRSYVRERAVLEMRDAVHRMTGLAARRVGLRERGLIAPGMQADMVVLDPTSVRERATFESPIAYPEGIRHVWVNGVHTVNGGDHTGATAGMVLRGG